MTTATINAMTQPHPTYSFTLELGPGEELHFNSSPAIARLPVAEEFYRLSDEVAKEFGLLD